MAEGLDWAEEDAEHLRTRSARYPGAANIEPAWANEAYADPDAVVFEPDPKSISGESSRVIGYSRTARFVITVIYITAERRGVTAWKTTRCGPSALPGPGGRRWRGLRPSSQS